MKIQLPHVVFSILFFAATAVADVQVSGDLAVWHPVTLTVDGPRAQESGSSNPFRDYRMSVTFTHEGDGGEYVVPGFFAADGNAAETGATAGNKWRAYFTPDQAGEWRYRVSFRGGEGVALSDDPDAGEPLKPDGLSGEFTIEASDGTGDDPRDRGLLRYVGERYLQFAGSGESFIKGGADSPENFLAYAGFDDTYSVKTPGAARDGEAALSPLHRYQPHVKDWNPGDPTWRDGKGKGIIGALNYLAAKGMNSVYFLTMNVMGDGRDVWPWTAEDERYRFDCSKLDQWNIVFDHMDRLGLMMHVVLTETENESLFEVEEGGEFADSRRIYYRELIARFGHHTAVVWNLGEENGWDDREKETTETPGRANSDEQRKAFAEHLRQLDAYDRPIVVHTLPGRQDEIYTPLLGFEHIEGPSLQMGNMKGAHEETIKWIDRSAEAGRPWFVCLDEIGPASAGVKPDAEDADHDDVRHHALWGNLMAGGAGVEWYFGYRFPHNDLNMEDFRSREAMWDQTRYALEFFQEHLPFTRMRHADEWTRDRGDYCFAEPGRVYAVYRPATGTPGGGATELWLPDAAYTVRWYDPRSGGELQNGSVQRVRGPGYQSIGTPPGDGGKDWVALVELDGDAPAEVAPPPSE